MSPGPVDYLDLDDETARDAESYRYLRGILRDTMTDPDVWDGEESEDYILGEYIKWLAAGQPRDEDGCPDRHPVPAPAIPPPF